MAKEYKFDIFKALAAVDRRDGDYFGKLPEEEQKEFSPFMFIRWASMIEGRAAEDNLHVINEILNPHMYDLAKEHPELVFRLGAMCGNGIPRQQRKWIGAPQRKTASSKAWNFIAQYYPEASEKEIDMLLRMHTRESFAEFIDDAAIQDKNEVLELMKSYDQLTGKASSGKTEEKPKPRKRKT